jgi:hypothetical protein
VRPPRRSEFAVYRLLRTTEFVRSRTEIVIGARSLAWVPSTYRQKGVMPMPTTTPDRTLLARYGSAIVSRTIGTIPTLLLRWQANLGLRDEHVVTIANILSYYSTPPDWKSVSIDSMARWRGVPRGRIEKTIAELEDMGYLSRPGRDHKHGGSFFFDLSLLLKRLAPLALVEKNEETLRWQIRALRTEALRELATTKANRGPVERTGTEKLVKEDSYGVRLGEDQ